MWIYIFDVFIGYVFFYDKKNIKDMENFYIKNVKEIWCKMVNKRF